MSNLHDRTRPHAVYRCYDRDGQLLYVGCTVTPEARWRKWRGDRSVSWPAETASWTITWYPDFASGRRSEWTAIRTEHPRHNRQGKPGVVIGRMSPERRLREAAAGRSVMALYR